MSFLLIVAPVLCMALSSPEPAPFDRPLPEQSEEHHYSQKRTLRFTLADGAFIWSAWGTATYRQNIDSLRMAGLEYIRSARLPDADTFFSTLPIAGPLVSIAQLSPSDDTERWQLVLVSFLQVIGVTSMMAKMIYNENTDDPNRAELVLSPLVAGHLGISISLLNL